MKKILPLIFLAVLMIFAMAHTSEADITYADFPNGDSMEFWTDSSFDGVDHVIFTYIPGGPAYATILAPDGWPDNYYGFSHLYQDTSGYIYYSTDGVNFYPF
jgi:hypothetical protein